MAKYEIERKFLLNEEKWEEYKNLVTQKLNIIQGYLSRENERTVRVRICNQKAWLTIKGLTVGDKREEYEYEIPKEDAESLMKMCVGSIIEKTRYILNHNELKYEIDIFEGRNKGLKLCEVELPESGKKIDLPSFIGREVTGDPKYYNSNL